MITKPPIVVGVTIRWGRPLFPVKKIRIAVVPVRERPRFQEPNPSEAERHRCPEVFRCYCCLRRFSRSYFGGTIRGQRLCRACFPYLDEWLVGTMVKFDNRHRFAEFGAPGLGKYKPRRPAPEPIPDELMKLWWEWYGRELTPEEYEALIRARGMEWLMEIIREVREELR